MENVDAVLITLPDKINGRKKSEGKMKRKNADDDEIKNEKRAESCFEKRGGEVENF
ncbi:hypothetical protein HHL16_05585 [Pseudoflavitalea sp. G-6-1-2]|uniref:hypothetical protein n=1 Tax=Pseudoflavitalea sp. G-6-1-2 TaxID=2728841 RepID=UPI00146E625C|nr:hypothetical protein [Pseudoflavitalea sp. G-6-1-2]NML20333.1 hypothetical protein [Pseudoflavitalea sp. G-6-1-2]